MSKHIAIYRGYLHDVYDRRDQDLSQTVFLACMRDQMPLTRVIRSCIDLMLTTERDQRISSVY